MPLTIPQKQIFDDSTRFRVIAAGRRFGKTFLSLWEIAKVARYPNKKIFYIAPSYRMAKQILWDEAKEQFGKRKWIDKINETDMSIHLVNGTKISLRSADNYDSMRGVSLDLAIFDEAAFMAKEVWTEVIRPALSDRQGSAVFISTPKSFNWFKDIYDQGKTSNEEWSSYQFTTLEGGNVPEEEIRAAMNDLDEKTFRQEYMASFENYSGIIYYAFDDANINTETLPEETKIIYAAVDFNRNPISCAIAIPKGKDGIQIVDEIVIYSSNTDELVEEIRNRYPDHRVVAFPDPAGIQQKTSAGGKTDISILENAGFTVKYRRKHPSVRDRINAVNSLMCNSNGQRRLFINEKCKTTIKCFRQHAYKEGTRIPDKDSGLDHMPDAVGYMVEYLFPINKEVEVKKIATFGVY